MSQEYVLDTSSVAVEGRGVVDSDSGPEGADISADQALRIGNDLGFSTLNIPNTAVAGEGFTVSGEIYLDALVSLTDIDTRVIVETTDGQQETVDTRKLGAGQSDTFEVTLAAPPQGQQFDVTVNAQVNPPDYIPLIPSGWQTKASRTKQVRGVTQQQKHQRTLVEYAPWVAGGGGAGYVLTRNSDISPAAGAATGAAVGVGAKQYVGQGGSLIPDIAPSPLEAVAYAALLGTGAWLLTSTQDITGVGEGAGGPVRRVAGGARSAVGRLRGGGGGGSR